MEIRASVHAATLNLVSNVAKSVEDSVRSGEVEMDKVKVCVFTKKCTCAICFFGRLEFHVNANVCLVTLQHPAFKFIHCLFLHFCLYIYFFPSVRELQQDVRELSLTELPEVDPEENSAEFMGILIKVGTHAQHVVIFYPSYVLAAVNSGRLYGEALMYIVVLLPQALAKLKKIPDTIKAIMERLEPELKQIVKRSTTQIADHAYQRGESLAQESQPRYIIQHNEISRFTEEEDCQINQLRK